MALLEKELLAVCSAGNYAICIDATNILLNSTRYAEKLQQKAPKMVYLFNLIHNSNF